MPIHIIQNGNTYKALDKEHTLYQVLFIAEKILGKKEREIYFRSFQAVNGRIFNSKMRSLSESNFIARIQDN